MTVFAPTPTTTQDLETKKQPDMNILLEQYTAAYMRGEIDLKTYRERLRELHTRIDLRRVASKIQR